MILINLIGLTVRIVLYVALTPVVLALDLHAKHGARCQHLGHADALDDRA